MARPSEPDEADHEYFLVGKSDKKAGRVATLLGLQHCITKGAMRFVWGQGQCLVIVRWGLSNLRISVAPAEGRQVLIDFGYKIRK